jgi:hypothetical protein
VPDRLFWAREAGTDAVAESGPESGEH